MTKKRLKAIQIVLADRFLGKLEQEDMTKEALVRFISTYCHEIHMRPYLLPGCMFLLKTPDPAHPLARYGILLGAENYVEDKFAVTVAETLFHELIHIACCSAGLHEHSEESVERLCVIFAKKYPHIISVFEEVFAGLRVDRQSLADAYKRPFSVYLPGASR